MRFLLDTNVLLWVLSGSARIAPIRGILMSEESQIYVSSVSWWEIAIKVSIGKLQADLVELRSAAEKSGYIELPLLGWHAEKLVTMTKHHKDPFDHMMIAQALSEPMPLITGDTIIPKYSTTFIKI